MTKNQAKKGVRGKTRPVKAYYPLNTDKVSRNLDRLTLTNRELKKSFLTACRDGDLSSIRQHLLDGRGDWSSQKDEHGNNGLMLLLLHHHPDAAAFLLSPPYRTEISQLDSFASASNHHQETPLLIARQNNWPEVYKRILLINTLLVERLFEKENDDELYSAFFTACARGREEIVALFLQEGNFEPFKPDKSGTTALMVACQYSHTEIARTLYESGADPYEKNKQNEFAITLAYHAGNIELLKLFTVAKQPYYKNLSERAKKHIDSVLASDFDFVFNWCAIYELDSESTETKIARAQKIINQTQSATQLIFALLSFEQNREQLIKGIDHPIKWLALVLARQNNYAVDDTGIVLTLRNHTALSDHGAFLAACKSRDIYIIKIFLHPVICVVNISDEQLLSIINTHLRDNPTRFSRDFIMCKLEELQKSNTGSYNFTSRSTLYQPASNSGKGPHNPRVRLG
ncbi:MAG: ankyrin repeat domain-containing protein [Pseudomonadota bacterium]